MLLRLQPKTFSACTRKAVRPSALSAIRATGYSYQANLYRVNVAQPARYYTEQKLDLDFNSSSESVKPMRPRKEIPADAQTVYVSNLHYDVTARDLRNDFSQFGVVHRVFIPKNRDTGRPRGIAFVTMEPIAINDAITGMNGRQLNGRPINCVLSKPRPQQQE
eukprot:TRINITY_DN503_c0_g1_i1.p1 TRINITY_DN503_c0_g1~~TRINITY_DN503_c0_g1_i1.p1  ORF type:complete len:163 (-),score=21.68 TRINITY_DN503_c0_g1_i1:44-532(-)